MGKIKRELAGQKWHKLTVVKQAYSDRAGLIKWNCLCECGNETIVSTDHLTRKNNPVKSCGCHRKRHGINHKDWTGCGDISGAWWASHITREINQTKRHKVCMNLTIEWAWELFLEQDRKCALSGIPLSFGSRAEFNSASLDRIDSSKGYEIGNVQWVHKDVNFMKRCYSQEYFIDLCKKIANKNNS